ncbi:MAG TPA: hypothetical protein VIV40_34920, partial [Kofleriaceae bacterium]
NPKPAVFCSPVLSNEVSMANPGSGYPQMPMGGPPMGGHGGPPMGGRGGPPMGGPGGSAGPTLGVRPPVRRGTPKIVPIIMSAGLAVGVFCGLLFGVGKKSEAVASPSKGTSAKADEPKAAAPTAVKPAQPATAAPAGSAAKPATVATGSAAPAAAPATVPAVVADKKNKLVVTLKPEAAMKDAKLYIDGKEVEGMTVELPLDKKQVKVEVKSPGYRSVDKKIDINGDVTSVEFETAKRPSGGTTPTVRPPKRPDKPPSGNGGGLIDI